MRRWIVGATLIGAVPLWTATVGWAAEIAAASRIQAVTLYPNGAEVVRLVQMRIEAGEHVVLLKDLPAQVVPASIRVEGKATGQLDIGSVDQRRLFVLRDGEGDAAAVRRQLEADIERLKDERARLEGAMAAAEAQKTLIQNLAQLPTVPPGSGVSAAPVDWAAILGLIGARFAEAQQKIIDSKAQLRDVDRTIEDAGKKLAALAPRRLEQTEVKINVAAAGAVDAELRIRYQVTDAGWQPLYDARLETGGRNSAPKLTLARRAALRQRTGEPWTDVAVTLSTARPTAGAQAPEVRPLTVDFVTEPPRPQPLAAPPPAPLVRSAPEALESRKVVDAMTAGAPATEVAAQLDATAFSAAFSVRDRVTLPETGETKTVLVDEQALEPTLMVRAVPRVDARAYLYARITVPRTAPYLPGPVSLFRDRTFAGTSRLPQLAPGETHELGFGADDLVRVRFSPGEEKRGEGGLISSTRTDERGFRINIRNLHERPVMFSVVDQIPVSLNQEIKVDLIGRTPPTRRDIDDKRGVLAWEDRLNPDEERTIEFGYRVSWPASKSIVYGR